MVFSLFVGPIQKDSKWTRTCPSGSRQRDSREYEGDGDW